MWCCSIVFHVNSIKLHKILMSCKREHKKAHTGITNFPNTWYKLVSLLSHSIRVDALIDCKDAALSAENWMRLCHICSENYGLVDHGFCSRKMYTDTWIHWIGTSYSIKNLSIANKTTLRCFPSPIHANSITFNKILIMRRYGAYDSVKTFYILHHIYFHCCNVD